MRDEPAGAGGAGRHTSCGSAGRAGRRRYRPHRDLTLDAARHRGAAGGGVGGADRRIPRRHGRRWWRVRGRLAAGPRRPRPARRRCFDCGAVASKDGFSGASLASEALASRAGPPWSAASKLLAMLEKPAPAAVRAPRAGACDAPPTPGRTTCRAGRTNLAVYPGLVNPGVLHLAGDRRRKRHPRLRLVFTVLGGPPPADGGAPVHVQRAARRDRPAPSSSTPHRPSGWRSTT